MAAWNGGAGYMPAAGSGKHTHLNAGNGLNGTGGGYEAGWASADNVDVAPTDLNLQGTDPLYATWTSAAGSNEKLPINCANWFEAYAFCIWDGGFLPSEAEWGYAAAGGSQQRMYPWGATDPGTANQYGIYGCNYPSGTGVCADRNSIAPVGTAQLGAGFWGHLDLGGNLNERILDWYSATPSPTCTDCTNNVAATERVRRGGNALAGVVPLLSSVREAGPPSARGNGGMGFRCARTP